MGEIKVEFTVKMQEKCTNKIRSALNGMGDVQIDASSGRVTVHTMQPWSMIQDKIESTGCKAALTGFGGQSAVAVINTTGSDVDKDLPIQGVVRFSAIASDRAGVVVDGVLDGLTPGLHGLHVHECGDISRGCASVGERYSRRGTEYEPSQRQAGDLGNICADQAGRATFRLIDPLLEVWDIIGRSVVVTAQADDPGRSRDAHSQVNGNTGERIACGIIARSAGIMQNFKKICACDGVMLWDSRSNPDGNKTGVQKL